MSNSYINIMFNGIPNINYFADLIFIFKTVSVEFFTIIIYFIYLGH